MTIRISWELLLFTSERLDILCAWIGHSSERLWPFQYLESFRCSISSVSICDVPESDLRVITYDHLNFSRASVVQFRASQYMMCLNRTSEWKVMTISISQELPWFNFGRLHMWCAWIGFPCEKLWPFEQWKLSRNSNGHNFTLGGPIQAHNISRHPKFKNRSSREIEMVITFHSVVRFRSIIYRDPWNWAMEALEKFK